MKKMKYLFVICAATLLAPGVWAQGPGGGGPGGGGGRMRNSPKFRLTGLMRGIGHLERSPKARLSPAQAQRIVSAVAPWQRKPRMSDAEAKALYMQVNSVLTTQQKNELDKNAAKNRRFGGGGGREGGGGDRPRGGMGMGGFGGGLGSNGPSDEERQKMRRQMQSMRGFMQTVNPFYSPTNYPEFKQAPERMQEGMKRRFDTQKKLIADLAVKARGAKKR